MVWFIDQLLYLLDLAAAGALWAFFALTLIYFTVEVLRHSPRQRWRWASCFQFELRTFFRMITALACTFALTGRMKPAPLAWDYALLSRALGFVAIYLGCYLSLIVVAFFLQEMAMSFRKRPFSIPRMWREQRGPFIQVREPQEKIDAAPEAPPFVLVSRRPPSQAPRRR